MLNLAQLEHAQRNLRELRAALRSTLAALARRPLCGELRVQARALSAAASDRAAAAAALGRP